MCTLDTSAPAIPRDLYQLAGEGPIGSTDSSSTAFTLDIGYALNDAISLRSVTGYRDMDAYENRESDESACAQSFFDGASTNFSDFWSREFQLSGTGGAAWAGGTSGSGFDIKPNDLPAYVNTGIQALNPTGDAPPAITLVNIGMPRQVGLDFQYRF